MNALNIFEAKTNFSKCISAIENKEEPYIIFMRSGKPVAKLVPYEGDVTRKLGLARGEIPDLRSIDEFNSIDVESDFSGNGGLL